MRRADTRRRMLDVKSGSWLIAGRIRLRLRLRRTGSLLNLSLNLNLRFLPAIHYSLSTIHWFIAIDYSLPSSA